jgi:TRAP transporter 4TM/12TM fusion protein
MIEKLKKSYIEILITVVSVIMVLYHLVYTQTLLLGPIEHQNMHLLLALMLLILIRWQKTEQIENKTKRIIARSCLIAMFVMTIISTGYIFYFFEALEDRIGMNTQWDIIIGIILLVVVMELCRQAVGSVLPIMALIFIGYTMLGHYLNGMLWHFKIPLSSAVSKFVIGFSGIFGQSMGISADYIFLFMVFGSFLSIAGGTKFFIELGKIIGRRSASGPGMTAIISCALVGMVTGSGMANASICGPFAVPMMRNVGYTKEQTSGILTTAATGALLVPPMMGVVAFVMAEYIGIPYLRICQVAIAPSILYYFCIAAYVIFAARKQGIKKMEGATTNVKELFSTSYLFFVPLAEIIVLLVMGYSLRMISFIIIVSIFLLSFIKKETRRPIKDWIEATVEGATAGAGIAVACACIGIVLASFDITGLGLKFPAMVAELANGSLLIALLLIAFITMLLGCGIPPFASYMIVAMMCAPVMIKLGCTVLQAHFFIFLFTVFGQMTPPVAITAVAAAPLCNVSYLRAGIEAVKVGWLAWIMPFFIIWCPELVLESNDYFYAAVSMLGIVLMVISFQASFLGYFKTKMAVWERIVGILSGLFFVVFEFTTGSVSYLMFGLGIVLFGIVLLSQYKRSKNTALQTVETANV